MTLLLLAIGTICFAPNERYTACVQYAADGQVTEIAVKPDRIDRVETLTASEYASLRATFEKMRPLGTRTELPFLFYTPRKAISSMKSIGSTAPWRSR